LGLIRGWTQRLAKPDIDAAEREQRTHAVIEECDRVTVRINQFLAFARPLDPAPQSVDVDGLIDELAAILQPDLEIKQLTLMRESSRPAAPVQADRELLRQALFNLLQNAIQFSPAGEAVGVAVVARHNGVCRIEVRDRGPGVAEQHVKSLFTPYFTTRPDGTGLGLAIVRRIAAVHGWTVDHRPRPGGGAVFFLDGIHG
jgi:signal transduction histidine kinase